MKNIEIANIVVNAKPGTTVGECVKECITLAATEWRNVILIFGNNQYKIYVNSLLDVGLSHVTDNVTNK